MAQSAETIGNGITNVAEERRSRGLWLDALLRLLRNRAAVVGFIIIVINFLIAFFRQRPRAAILRNTNPHLSKFRAAMGHRYLSFDPPEK